MTFERRKAMSPIHNRSLRNPEIRRCLVADASQNCSVDELRAAGQEAFCFIDGSESCEGPWHGIGVENDVHTNVKGSGTRASLRHAIDGKCKDCAHDEITEGTWRQQVGSCSNIACTLWPVRPLPNRAPAWLASRDPEQLPRDWNRLTLEEAVSMIKIDD